jgi:hypothetical protein
VLGAVHSREHRTYAINKYSTVPSCVPHKEASSIQKVARLGAYHEGLADCAVIQNLLCRFTVRLIKTSRESRHNFEMPTIGQHVFVVRRAREQQKPDHVGLAGNISDTTAPSVELWQGAARLELCLST